MKPSNKFVYLFAGVLSASSLIGCIAAESVETHEKRAGDASAAGSGGFGSTNSSGGAGPDGGGGFSASASGGAPNPLLDAGLLVDGMILLDGSLSEAGDA